MRLGKRGDATVQIKLLVKLGGDVTKRNLNFGIPPALSSQLALTLDQPDADVDFPTAISFKRSSANEKTRVEAVIGSGDRVELLWTPRVKRAAEVAATIFCQNNALSRSAEELSMLAPRWIFKSRKASCALCACNFPPDNDCSASKAKRFAPGKSKKKTARKFSLSNCSKEFLPPIA